LAYEDSAIWVGTATTNFTNLTLFGGNSTYLWVIVFIDLLINNTEMLVYQD
jgi:hypothetical protein